MKKIKCALFAAFACIQLSVPLFSVWEQHDIVKSGELYLFKTEPIDPTDPFRGKYIRLNYTEDSFPVKNREEWQDVKNAYAVISADEDGFAKISSVEKEPPSDVNNYVAVEVFIAWRRDEKKKSDYCVLKILYPFERFYMEESKAAPAEQLFSDNKTCYAAVYLKNGKAVLHNVYIDGVPIAEAVGKAK